jgi:hypothetical protein
MTIVEADVELIPSVELDEVLAALGQSLRGAPAWLL